MKQDKSAEVAAKKTAREGFEGQRGFTLLGVLIAVLIVGLMASMAVPKFSAALSAANTAKIQSDLSTIDSSIALYRIDKGNAPASLEDLENYLENYEQIKPPTGECNINGDTVDVPAKAYTISPNESGRMQAHLGKYTLYDFGGKKKS